MGIYQAYKEESRPTPAIEVTLSENKPESDSLVGCNAEQLSDLYTEGRLIETENHLQDLRKFPFEPPFVGANGRSPLLYVVSMP